jgi:hypothetical protein
MNLDEGQRKKIAEWVRDGLKLADIQKRIGSEFGVTLTYMDVRFLVDDLKVMPKDIEPPKPATSPLQATATPAATGIPASPPPGGGAAGGGISVQVDAITRPGAVVSGKVTFSDANTAEWYLDQTGRLGFVPAQAGYRPSPPDLQQFQAALDAELRKLGF